MVEIRVQLDGSYNLCRSIQYPSLFIRAAGPLRVAFSALLAAAIIVAFIIREQCQISIKFQEDKERSAHLSYSKICRRFLPALCEGRPVVSGRIFEKLDCTKVRNNRYFQERKCFHGYPQFLLSPEKAADLMNLVRFVSTFKDRDQAAGPRIAVRVLHSTLIKQIVCLLKRSVWISAKLETVRSRKETEIMFHYALHTRTCCIFS